MRSCSAITLRSHARELESLDDHALRDLGLSHRAAAQCLTGEPCGRQR